MERTLFLDAGNTRIKAAERRQDRFMSGRPDDRKDSDGPQNPSEGKVAGGHGPNERKVGGLQGLPCWKQVGTAAYDAPDFKSILHRMCLKYDRIVLASVKRRFQADDLLKWLQSDTGNTGNPKEAGSPVDRGNRKIPEILGINGSHLTPGTHCYRTPETLGIDRYLACLGAWSNDEACPVVVSDAGTACTIDAMDAGGVYHGGVIMPGLQMLIDTLGRGADGLFPVSPRLPDHWPPGSTTAALQAGTAGSYLAAWEAHVRRTRDLFPDARVWLTGGDADFLEQSTDIECLRDDFLVFEGMHHWLLHGLPGS
ncbi:MAG: type III pantothenate kinase [Cyclonatronaceae bacterium]